MGRRRSGGDVARLQAFGIGEIAVKNGRNAALVADKNGRAHVPVPEMVERIDTTAAGDWFNAGYLAARLKGEMPMTAVGAARMRWPRRTSGTAVPSCRGRRRRCIALFRS